MQHHSANRKRASIKIKGSSLQCLHAPRHDDTGSRVPGIRLGLQNRCILMSCCFFRELKGFTYAKCIKHHLNWKKTLKHVKKDADLPCQEIRKMKRRRVRRLTWWICQVRSFCWNPASNFQQNPPTNVYLYGVHPVILLAMNILCIKAWNLLGLSWFGVTARLDWRRCGRFSWSFLSKLTSKQHFW